MANSHFIKTLVEPAMRLWLTKDFGMSFSERAMPIRWNGEGAGSFRFDAVSEDGTIIACLSAAYNLKAGQKHKLMRDATFMWLVPGVKRRVMVVVEQTIAEGLGVELRCGRIPPETEIRLVDLPFDIRQRLGTFRVKAAKEVGGSASEVPSAKGIKQKGCRSIATRLTTSYPNATLAQSTELSWNVRQKTP